MRNTWIAHPSAAEPEAAKHARRLLPALFVPLLLAACSGTDEVPSDAPAGSAPLPEAVPAEDAEPPTAGSMASVEGTLQGFVLTDEEADALRAAHASRGHLSMAEVASVLGLDAPSLLDTTTAVDHPEASATSTLGRLSLAVRRGEDSSIGDCSVITLIGLDDGRYHFEQFLFGGASSLFGEIVISTDGLLAIPDIYGVEGPQQIFDDDLFEGIFATGTTMSGWMFTTNNNLCFGELFAHWE